MEDVPKWLGDLFCINFHLFLEMDGSLNSDYWMAHS